MSDKAPYVADKEKTPNTKTSGGDHPKPTTVNSPPNPEVPPVTQRP